MGIGGISIWQLLIIALIIVLLGTKKLRNLGSDLGGALKGFKSAIKDDDEETDEKKESEQLTGNAEHEQEQEQASDNVHARTRDADEKQ